MEIKTTEEIIKSDLLRPNSYNSIDNTKWVKVEDILNQLKFISSKSMNYEHYDKLISVLIDELSQNKKDNYKMSTPLGQVVYDNVDKGK